MIERLRGRLHLPFGLLRWLQMNMDGLTFGRLRGFGGADKWLLLLSIVCSALYLATQSIQPFPGSIVLKALVVYHK